MLRYSRENENMVPGQDYAQTAGCTANVALITRTHIYVANAGDSRCVAGKVDGSYQDYSQDHKPSTPEEQKRIVSAGHTVENDRVDGKIAISRAIGDWGFK